MVPRAVVQTFDGWVYSHQKFYKPPTILEPAIMPEEECQDMFAQKAYIFQEKTIKIQLNEKIQFSEIPNGRIWSTMENSYCIGAKFKINWEIHEQMLELNTIEISMTEVDILENNNKLTDLQNNLEMDKRCLDNMKSIIGTHAYLLLDQPTKCKWAKIQTMQLTPIQLIKKGTLNNYYVNREHRIILRKINQKTL